MLALIALGWIGYVIASWPRVGRLAEHNPETTAFIERYRSKGAEPEWRFVPYEQISDDLKKAVLVAEDINFFSHSGFDREEMRRALEDALDGRRLRGASTVSQQLAKNLWLSPSRNPLRKLKEVVLTRQLERHLSKRRILEIYLNVVEYGPGVYGAEAAARRYFGKAASSLSLDEASRMAASLPSSTWFPGSESTAYRAHVERVRARVAKVSWLDRHL